MELFELYSKEKADFFLNGVILEIMSMNGKNIHEIGVFLDSNLNFTIRVFTWGLAS